MHVQLPRSASSPSADSHRGNATTAAPAFVRFAGGAGTVVIVIGLLGLEAWAFDVEMLKSVVPGRVSMKANTALTLVLAGLSLRLRARPGGPRRRRAAIAAAWAVVLMGAVVLLEYLSGWDPGIDQLFFREPPSAVDTTFPGRMSPLTAMAFVIVGGRWCCWMSPSAPAARRKSWRSRASRWRFSRSSDSRGRTRRSEGARPRCGASNG